MQSAIPDPIQSRFDLVLLAATRVHKINTGSPILIPRNKHKNTVIALLEIKENKLNLESLDRSLVRRLSQIEDDGLMMEEEVSIEDMIFGAPLEHEDEGSMYREASYQEEDAEEQGALDEEFGDFDDDLEDSLEDDMEEDTDTKDSEEDKEESEPL